MIFNLQIISTILYLQGFIGSVIKMCTKIVAWTMFKSNGLEPQLNWFSNGRTIPSTFV